MKNIPLPSENTYLKCLTEKVENVLRRMRWTANFFDNKNDNEPATQNFGFKNNKTPPKSPHLVPFEDDMYEIIQKIEFRKVNNEFQKKLARDVKSIKQNKNLLVSADKTTNLYEMKKEDYSKLLQENITKTYKKSRKGTREVNREAKVIAKKLGLADKVEAYVEKEAYITLKDHKDNFQSNPKCRLINPAKSQMGKVSKKYLERIVSELSTSLKVNQWRNTDTVIKWFKSIPHKKRSKFLKFDIVEFYPSISETLLNKAIDFAKRHVNISTDEIKAIKHARKSFLVSQREYWTKKGSDSLFDVTMGSFDGAEICELVGIFLLNELTNLLGRENVGLYRDDGLAVMDKASGPQLDKMRKDIIALFQLHGLKITIDTNLSVVEFLDVAFDLPRNRYYPHRKPNDPPLYINASSNHPKNIIKQVPEMINDRISNLSCNAREFNRVKDIYQTALNASDFNKELEYRPKQNKKKSRKRRIIWFNPPFSDSVKTNIGKIFIGLIKKHFPRHHRYYKIFNSSTLKLSYSCMPNIGSVINQHNTEILYPRETGISDPCDCNNPAACPLDGQCKSENTVYKAIVTSNSSGSHEEPVISATPRENLYYGIASGPFKPRYRNHTKSFNNRQYEHDTKLSEFVWKLKDRDINYTVKWEIVSNASPYRAGSNRCNLCVSEKVVIARCNHKGLLNKRTELLNKCRHKNKFMLESVT